ncbi:MAG TPA: thioredoxin fold domain-containing protein [Verrucomicrobiae bacterium]|nr:thioredoxin fold domain-containing protein [Verrucomicrobiae bacterium]
MKRYILSLILISVTVWVWCNFSSAGETNQVVATAASTVPVNLAAEIARAKAENKLMLLEFGSSDTCPPCILFEREVASKPEFQAYEKSNLVFVHIDFPFYKPLPPENTATNNLLARQFDVNPLPTFISLGRDGKEFWRQEGIKQQQLAPKEFIALLESVKAKQK